MSFRVIEKFPMEGSKKLSEEDGRCCAYIGGGDEQVFFVIVFKG